MRHRNRSGDEEEEVRSLLEGRSTTGRVRRERDGGTTWRTSASISFNPDFRSLISSHSHTFPLNRCWCGDTCTPHQRLSFAQQRSRPTCNRTIRLNTPHLCPQMYRKSAFYRNPSDLATESCCVWTCSGTSFLAYVYNT